MTVANNALCLRPARLDELEALSELCLRAKSVWGYDAAFIEACRAELMLHASDLAGDAVYVAECGGAVVGLAQVSSEGTVASLEKLFIEPSAMRTGLGRQLFDWAARKARVLGARELNIESDPGAAEFYRRMGAGDDGFAASASIPGRTLPRLKLTFDKD